jgi:uncharacterized protein YciI
MTLNILGTQQLAIGEDWQIPIQFNDADGNDLDVTGASILWILEDMGQNVVMWATQNDYIRLDPAGTNGIVSATLVVDPDAQSNNDPTLVRGMYEHGVRVTLPSGVVSIQAIGKIELLDNVFSRHPTI